MGKQHSRQFTLTQSTSLSKIRKKNIVLDGLPHPITPASAVLKSDLGRVRRVRRGSVSSKLLCVVEVYTVFCG